MATAALKAMREFELTEDDFRFLARQVYELTGIVIHERKRDMLYSRLPERYQDALILGNGVIGAAMYRDSARRMVLLVSRSRSPAALEFYHAEALRGGWSVRQLARQIDSRTSEAPFLKG